MFDTLFGWWQYDFMRNAFVAVLLIMPLFALLGTQIGRASCRERV